MHQCESTLIWRDYQFFIFYIAEIIRILTAKKWILKLKKNYILELLHNYSN